ncbi:MAG: hypothetical protein ACK5Q5_08225 [Planctomycetaceae bacterium]
MSIRVQCGGCGSVMTVRDDYAGTKRRCPKCKGEFQVPTLEEARAAEAAKHAGGGIPGPEDPDFDPVAFLTGEAPAAKAKPSPKLPAAKPTPPADFDPMDVLDTGPAKSKGSPSPSKTAESKPKTAESKLKPQAADKPASPAADDFDPLDVLAKPSSPPPAASQPSTPPTPAAPPPVSPPAASASSTPEKPKPNRPAWAKAAPTPEVNDWDDPPAEPPAPAPTEPAPPAAPEKPTPRRPSWAKAAPTPEVNDWDDPQPAEPATPPAAPTPKRPSWAKPLPGEAAATEQTDPHPDASPAALAAASAMAAGTAAVSGDNPALQEQAPRRPLFDRAAVAAWFRRRLILLLQTAAVALVLFGLSWFLLQPRGVDWKVIGKNDRLAPVPVNGQLTVDGQPVANARLTFFPRGRQYRASEGMTDATGHFDLVFCEGTRGAPAGRYRVQLHYINKDGSDAGATADNLLRGQTFEVPPGGGTVDVALSTKTKPGPR